MSVIMDHSAEHDGVFVGGEAADELPLTVIPSSRGKPVVYQEKTKKLVVTGHVIVACCCHDIRSYLAETEERPVY
jgi:hypothetical protein